MRRAFGLFVLGAISSGAAATTAAVAMPDGLVGHAARGRVAAHRRRSLQGLAHRAQREVQPPRRGQGHPPGGCARQGGLQTRTLKVRAGCVVSRQTSQTCQQRAISKLGGVFQTSSGWSGTVTVLEHPEVFWNGGGWNTSGCSGTPPVLEHLGGVLEHPTVPEHPATVPEQATVLKHASLF